MEFMHVVMHNVNGEKFPVAIFDTPEDAAYFSETIPFDTEVHPVQYIDHEWVEARRNRKNA